MLIHKLGFSLDYLPDACSNVDSIRTINGMMGQRKRWINGSEWAFDKVINEINTG